MALISQTDITEKLSKSSTNVLALFLLDVVSVQHLFKKPTSYPVRKGWQQKINSSRKPCTIPNMIGSLSFQQWDPQSKLFLAIGSYGIASVFEICSFSLLHYFSPCGHGETLGSDYRQV